MWGDIGKVRKAEKVGVRGYWKGKKGGQVGCEEILKGKKGGEVGLGGDNSAIGKEQVSLF